MLSPHFASVFGPGLHFNSFHSCVTYSSSISTSPLVGSTACIIPNLVCGGAKTAMIVSSFGTSVSVGLNSVTSLPCPSYSLLILSVMYTWIVVLEMPKRQFPDNLESFEIVASNPYSARKLAMHRFSKYSAWWSVSLKTWGP